MKHKGAYDADFTEPFIRDLSSVMARKGLRLLLLYLRKEWPSLLLRSCGILSVFFFASIRTECGISTSPFLLLFFVVVDHRCGVIDIRPIRRASPLVTRFYLFIWRLGRDISGHAFLRELRQH